jgi:hypothetical protein
VSGGLFNSSRQPAGDSVFHDSRKPAGESGICGLSSGRAIQATAWLASPLGTKPFCRINETILKQARAIVLRWHLFSPCCGCLFHAQRAGD